MIIRNFFLQPIFGFILLGSVLFIVDQQINSQQQMIHFSNADAKRLKAQWQSQFQSEFNQETLLKLLYQEATEKRLYLEAKALGLDENDIIVQRRLAQKLKFISEDLSDLSLPNENQLMTYFENNIKYYSTPHFYSFQHLFFKNEDSNNASQRISEALKNLQQVQLSGSTQWSEFGDPFDLGAKFSNQSKQQVKMIFGDEFMQQLATIATQKWTGPIRSSLGSHLVKITNIRQPSVIPFNTIKQKVLADWQKNQADNAFQHYLHDLAVKYPVSITIDNFSISEVPEAKNFNVKQK